MRKSLAALLFYLGLASAALAQVITMPPPGGVAIMGCVYNTSPPTLTTGQIGYVQCNSAGSIGGGSSGGAVFGPTAAGSASVNPPVQIGGTTTGATGANVAGAAVKPASTAAVSTDTSLVLQLNPLSPGIITYVDPCQNPGVLKSSVAINTSSATTTQLVAISGSTSIYVCGFSVSVNNVITTASTFQFEYGTSTNCTGANKLTGVYNTGSVTAGVATAFAYGGAGMTIFTAPSANGLCILTAGTGDDDGVLTYVQQ